MFRRASGHRVSEKGLKKPDKVFIAPHDPEEKGIPPRGLRLGIDGDGCQLGYKVARIVRKEKPGQVVKRPVAGVQLERVRVELRWRDGDSSFALGK